MALAMIVPAGTTQLVGLSGTIYTPDANGVIQVQQGDVVGMLSAGCLSTDTFNRSHAFTAPLAATAGKFVASRALSNGATVAFANQPDVPRQGNVVIWPGTLALTAGQVAVSYWGNDGQQHTDTIQTVAAASTLVTFPLSFGAVRFLSASVSGIVGGVSPAMQIDSTGALALNMSPGGNPIIIYNEIDTATVQSPPATANTTNGVVTPQTALNGTVNYSFGYTEQV